MSRISSLLCDWYARHGRDLPWRRTRDPYRIWLSEVILQQTRVAQGLEYYLRFTERFPRAELLAAASEDEVLKLWQGLGYYSRARHLHAAAQEVAARFDGAFPRTYEEVRALPGVGDYTAAAICSMAYDLPYAVLDGNVFRVLSRVFDLDVPIDTSAGRRTFAELARAQLDPKRPGTCNQAIMDFGALCCTPGRPDCASCPLGAHCLAHAAGTTAERPVKRSRTKVRERWFVYLHLVCDGETLLHRRGAGDIWQGLYEFPLIETPGEADYGRVAETALFRELCGGAAARPYRKTDLPRHQLSHQTLHGVVYRIELARWPEAAQRYLRVAEEHLGDYALPRLLDRYLNKYQR